MSEVPHSTAGDDGGLGAWLGGAADSFRTVRVTYRTWRDNQRLAEAFRSHYAEQRRRGARTVTWAAAAGSGPGPTETEETVRIWREGQKIRQEHHGGLRDGYYGVIDGSWWWSWSEPFGAMNGPGDSGGGIDRGVEIMLDPAPLAGVLDLRMAGNSRVAGRASVTAHAVPRDLSEVRVAGYSRAFRALHGLGLGADS